MPIIDPDGYFGGDRFAMVSDSARMVWPTFFLASNTVARIELSYDKVIAKAFYRWKKKPTETQFWAWIEEYSKAFLLFVYETEDGQIWGQWDTSEEHLVKYKLKADLESPAPTARDFLEWKNQYVSTKKSKSNAVTIFRNFSKNSERFPLQASGGGVGVGVGGGKAEEDAPQASPNPPIPIDKSPKGSRFTLRPLSPEWVRYAMEKRGWSQDETASVYEAFTDFWISKAGSDGIKLDWFATWRTWVRNQRSRDGPMPPKSAKDAVWDRV